MRMESPSVQPTYRNSYAPRARQNLDFRFRPNIARFPGQQLSLHKMQNSNVFEMNCFLQEGAGIWTYGVWGILQLIFLFCQNCYLFILTERQQIFYTMALDMVFVNIMQDREYLMNQEI